MDSKRTFFPFQHHGNTYRKTEIHAHPKLHEKTQHNLETKKSRHVNAQIEQRHPVAEYLFFCMLMKQDRHTRTF